MSSPPSSGATTPSDGSWVDVRAASAAAEGDEPPTPATRVSGKARGDDDGGASADAGCVGAGVERGSSRAPAAESNPGPRNTPDDIGDAVAALRSCAARRLRALAERLQPERSEDEEKDEEKDEDRLAKTLARVARSLASDIVRRVVRAVAEAYVACRLGFTRQLCPRSGEGRGVASRPRRRLRQLCAAPPWDVIAPLVVGLLVGLAWKRACAGGTNQPPPPRCGL